MLLRASRSPTRNVEASSRTSSRAASSAAAARTDEENHEDGLILRQRGLGLSVTLRRGMKEAYFKATPEKFVTPKQIANEIRRLRGHDRSTIYERHAKFNDGDRSCPHHDELVSLCTRLVNFSYGTKTTFSTQNELLALFVEDPFVHELSQIRGPSTLHPKIAYLNMSMDGIECHRRWSQLLGRSTFKWNQRLETAQHNCDALKATFKISSIGTVAIKYIPYAMILKVQNEDLELLHQLWVCFLDYVVRRNDPWFKVDNMDLCFRNIVSSGKSPAYFASPSQLERISMYLVEYSTELPFVFSTFFPLPRFEFRDPKDPYGAKLVIRLPARNWDIAVASSYAMSLLYDDTRGHLRMFYGNSLPEYIKKSVIRTPLERTIFVDSKMVDLYIIVDDAVISYRHAVGVLSDRKLEASIHHTLFHLAEPTLESISVANSLGETKKDKNVAIQNLYIAHTVDIDRYHKHQLLTKYRKNDGYIEVLNDRLRFQTYYQRPDGICNLTYIPQFRNVSYLRRFKIGSKYFITADGLPESSDRILNLWNREIFPEDITIDTMPLDGKLLTCLRVDRESPVFDCDGHYPILACFDFETKEPLYVAVVNQEVDSPWYFTTVKNGASSVTYTDEVGEERTAWTFFVLALRHDPIDLPPQDLEHRPGAEDPTGPVYWLEFWPRRDAHYPTDERLGDDRLLTEFLENLRERKTDPEECQLQELLSGFD